MRSYWQQSVFQLKYDLLIIGAGISGLSCAYHYLSKHPNAKVLILEKGLFPSGATVKNAGFACFGSAGELLADMDAEGEESVVNRVSQRIAGLKGLREVVTDDEIDFQQNGGYELFTDKTAYRKLLTRLDYLNSVLADVNANAKTFEPAKVNGYDAVFCKDEAVVHSGKLISQLMLIVQKMGAKIITGAEVTSINNAKVILKNTVEVFEAKKLILATNAYSSQILPEINIRPARAYVFVTNSLPQLKWRNSFHFDEGYIYFRNLGNRLLIGGARNADISNEYTFEEGINPLIKTKLINFANEVLKLDKGWKIDYEWCGYMGFAKDKNYISEEIKENVFLLAGYSGMGVSIAFKAAEEVITMI